ncbi:MAG: hypothetical protein Q7S48_03930 [bacterium]|nr:hypothetical protein [bacterium]
MSDRTQKQKTRTFFHALAESFDGLKEGSRGRTMRIIYCLLVGAAIGTYLRGISLQNWVIVILGAGWFISTEYQNNGKERQEDRGNRLVAALKRAEIELTDGDWAFWNEDTRHIKHQASAAVLVSGIFGLSIYIIIMVFNP